MGPTFICGGFLLLFMLFNLLLMFEDLLTLFTLSLTIICVTKAPPSAIRGGDTSLFPIPMNPTSPNTSYMSMMMSIATAHHTPTQRDANNFCNAEILQCTVEIVATLLQKITVANAKLLVSQEQEISGGKRISLLRASVAEDIRRAYMQLMSVPARNIQTLHDAFVAGERQFASMHCPTLPKRTILAAVTNSAKKLRREHRHLVVQDEFQSPGAASAIDAELRMPPSIIQRLFLFGICGSPTAEREECDDRCSQNSPLEGDNHREGALSDDDDSKVDESNTSRDLLDSFEGQVDHRESDDRRAERLPSEGDDCKRVLDDDDEGSDVDVTNTSRDLLNLFQGQLDASASVEDLCDMFETSVAVDDSCARTRGDNGFKGESLGLDGESARVPAGADGLSPPNDTPTEADEGGRTTAAGRAPEPDEIDISRLSVRYSTRSDCLRVAHSSAAQEEPSLPTEMAKRRKRRRPRRAHRLRTGRSDASSHLEPPPSSWGSWGERSVSILVLAGSRGRYVSSCRWAERRAPVPSTPDAKMAKMLGSESALKCGQLSGSGDNRHADAETPPVGGRYIDIPPSLGTEAISCLI